MWILEILNEKENLQVVRSFKLHNECVSIGRSVDGDIVLPSDRSISRKHAEIQITSNGLFLVDLKSTLGTFLNGIRIKSNEPTPLISGNLIKFGNEHTTARIVNVCYKFCPTRLEKPEKEKLKQVIGNIDAEIVKQVETCTHVLCNRFSATVKTLTAIVLQKPIVSFHWIESFANSSSNSVLIPDVKEFCPPGASELTSVEKLHLSRSELLKNCAIFLLFPNDSQYQIILEHCGAKIISLFGIDSIDELIRNSKERLLSLSDHRSCPCVFYDEGRPLDTKTIHLMKRFNIPFLGSGELATAIFTLSAPQFVTHEILSQRVSSQQSQVQASQNIEATTITSVPPQNSGISRTVTLVQTERVEIQEEKINQLCLDEQRIEAEIAKKKELKRQAEEKERKQREREEFERKEKEKERREQRLRQLEEEKIESEKKARLERERLLKSEQEKARKVTSEPLPSESPLNSRVKRSAGELLQSENNTIPQESNPIKKRRPEVNHSSTSNLLFEDQPLVKIEPSFHSQSSRCTIDTEGWTTIDKTNTGRNCIEMTPSLVHTSGTSTAPIQISSRRSVINFDDPNSSQFKINDTTHHVEYPQAVVVEMKFQMKSNQIHQNNHEGHQHPKDQRKFKKNLVRTLQINDRNPSLSSSSSLLPSPSMKLKKSDMDKVLPKESERELLLGQSYEAERRTIENRESLFSDSLTGNKTRKQRFGN